jgi:hypothetical protein
VLADLLISLPASAALRHGHLPEKVDRTPQARLGGLPLALFLSEGLGLGRHSLLPTIAALPHCVPR